MSALVQGIDSKWEMASARRGTETAPYLCALCAFLRLKPAREDQPSASYGTTGTRPTVGNKLPTSNLEHPTSNIEGREREPRKRLRLTRWEMETGGTPVLRF